MQFIDRKAKYPGRWIMKKSDGSSEIITLIRNDEPIVEGTPMNANTLNTLSDVAGADVARAAAERSAALASSSEKNAKASEEAAERVLASIPDEYTEMQTKLQDSFVVIRSLQFELDALRKQHEADAFSLSALGSLWNGC